MRLIVSLAIFINLFLLANAQQKEVNLLFVGDAMQHMPQVEAAQTPDGYFYDSCFYLLKDKIESADLSCVNFETTLGGPPFRGYPMFSSPDEYAVALKDVGFDIFFLANNHIMDSGKQGLERTLDVLDSIGVKHTGVFKRKESFALTYPLMIIKNGIRIAFLNYTYDTNGIKVVAPNIVNTIDTIQIKRDIRLAKLYKPDIIIANMHWGDEYFTRQNKEQERLASFLFDNGVRIIIGNHPHVVQPMIKNVKDNKIESVVFYSLGNFISNQRKTNTDGGAIAEIKIRKTGDDGELEIVSCNYSLAWVRKYMEGRKMKYTLIPKDYANEVSLALDEEDIMKTFFKNAKLIIEGK